MNKQELRKLIRKKRRALTPAQRHKAGRSLTRSLHHSTQYLSANRVALYLSNDGEIDPHWAIEDLWNQTSAGVPMYQRAFSAWLVCHWLRLMNAAIVWGWAVAFTTARWHLAVGQARNPS